MRTRARAREKPRDRENTLYLHASGFIRRANIADNHATNIDCPDRLYLPARLIADFVRARWLSHMTPRGQSATAAAYISMALRSTEIVVAAAAAAALQQQSKWPGGERDCVCIVVTATAAAASRDTPEFN